ncbi:hypothetical protein CK203_003954 [Vitis vinifera]|uniref:Uncharacterized protein n=1 Tax=Vitis vinifera TaxID=29760 RepID=A0A438K943_VITVI|nr:hypothetical protein CK203_003954 [Vitis vinifera]
MTSFGEGSNYSKKLSSGKGHLATLSVLNYLSYRTPGKQLRLFDIRLRQTELHAFGWKQESSDSLSALINQTWSPDGLYITLVQ